MVVLVSAQLDPVSSRRIGCIVWLTGLSGAGKTTIAEELRRRLLPTRDVEVLDGDQMRESLSKGLGYSRADRAANVFRIGFVARLLARHNIVCIVSAIAPYADDRDAVRMSAGAEGIPFLEVFLDASIHSLVARDPKGLYQKALAGELLHFTGITDPYERPSRPDLHLHTDAETIEQSVNRVFALVQNIGDSRAARAASAS
jgi:adenylylsulfate kinase